jgi:hypothetical protein
VRRSLTPAGRSSGAGGLELTSLFFLGNGLSLSIVLSHRL